MLSRTQLPIITNEHSLDIVAEELGHVPRRSRFFTQRLHQIADDRTGIADVLKQIASLLRRLDTRNVVVTPEEPLAEAPLLAGFETRPRAGGAFSVTYRTGQSSVEQVLAAVRATGLHIKDISTEDPDLEDVFVSLTTAGA